MCILYMVGREELRLLTSFIWPSQREPLWRRDGEREEALSLSTVAPALEAAVSGTPTLQLRIGGRGWDAGRRPWGHGTQSRTTHHRLPLRRAHFHTKHTCGNNGTARRQTTSFSCSFNFAPLCRSIFFLNRQVILKRPFPPQVSWVTALE